MLKMIGRRAVTASTGVMKTGYYHYFGTYHMQSPVQNDQENVFPRGKLQNPG